ncbi:unnamed protein product [Linum tenue]|uniref:Uncharacterized protein n=1 Tax=Linum tenue TaxID=586396 RepID=A0AAV0RVC1_9ROSI|nr:unnamed protein product [Linum tenue]
MRSISPRKKALQGKRHIIWGWDARGMAFSGSFPRDERVQSTGQAMAISWRGTYKRVGANQAIGSLIVSRVFTEPEREELLTKLQQVEDWMYESREDETKGVYIAKLEELNKVVYCLFSSGGKMKVVISFTVVLSGIKLLQQGDPIEHRYKESIERGSVIYQLGHCVNSYREAVVA